jgi:hypothetical protein
MLRLRLRKLQDRIEFVIADNGKAFRLTKADLSTASINWSHRRMLDGIDTGCAA